MKNKFIEFLKAKKELFMFLGLLAMTFVAVIVVAEVALNNEDTTTVAPAPESDNEDDSTLNPENDKEEVVYTFVAPVNSEYVIVREFFDFDTPGQNANAYFEVNGQYVMSLGVGFALESDEEFDVVTIYPGTVLSIEESDVVGTTISIDHGDVISTYYSVSNACVSVGELIDANTVIATASASTFDINASVHVHVEVVSKFNNEYIDLTTLIGKTMDDIASSIK